MASVIDTANPKATISDTDARGRIARPRVRLTRSWFLGSRLTGLIVVLNLLGLIILIGGALLLNESRQALVRAREDSLSLQGQLIANVIDQTATVGEPNPALEPDIASGVLQGLFIPHSQRARLYDVEGRLLADSFLVADHVEIKPLPPPRRAGGWSVFDLGRGSPAKRSEAARLALTREVARAMTGIPVANLRVDEDGHDVVSVSIPLRHVRAVLGVLTLEAGDVDTIIAAQRLALIPFILVAFGVALLSSLLLIQLIAVPVLRLARAADRVRLSRARTIDLPDLAERKDEVGDLARALGAMTQALFDRMVAIERFAADVSHELRNPMTSIRSALETLELVTDEAPRRRLAAILQHDVERMDRLITDISNASRLDAELARDAPLLMDLRRQLSDLCDFYNDTGGPDAARVRFVPPATRDALSVVGREGPLGQVFRNLIDNARSFSPPGGEVRVSVRRQGPEILVQVEDEGPGIPADNLETVFERFYTARPKGAAFGGNSGLGLAIARQIVETHGGRIWAHNRLDGDRVAGAVFTVALPIA